MLEYLLVAFNKLDLEEEKTEHICYVVEMNDEEKEAVTLVNRLVFETDISI